MTGWAIIGAVICAILGGVVQAAEPDWPEAISIATGSEGGTYDVYGEGLAKILSRDLGIRVSVIPTNGPTENIAMLADGRAQVGFVTLGVAYHAWEGTGDWEGRPQRGILAAFPMYDTPFHFVTLKESPVAGIGDLAGKRVGVGPEGGSSETYSPGILSRLGAEATAVTGTWEELTAQLKEGSLDALAVAAGVPFPAISELEAENRIRYLPRDLDWGTGPGQPCNSGAGMGPGRRAAGRRMLPRGAEADCGPRRGAHSRDGRKPPIISRL